MATHDVQTAPAPNHDGRITTWWPTDRGAPVMEASQRRDSVPFARRYTAYAVLVDRLAYFDALLAALEARPDGEGPLDACRAVADMPAVHQMVPGPDDLEVIDLLFEHPSLSGRFLWKVQAAAGRMAVELGRRMGVPHTDLRPQLLAAGVIAALNASIMTWLSDPAGPSANELTRRALVHLADGMGWPAAEAGPRPQDRD